MSERKQEALLFSCVAVMMAFVILNPLFELSPGTHLRLGTCTSISPEVRLKHGRYIVQFDSLYLPPATVKMFHNGESVILIEVDG